MMAYLGFRIAMVSAVPTGPITDDPMITKETDCIDFDTPESCDTFCFATFCMGLPEIL